MKVLLLTCNTGEGHNSCSAAILEACERRGIPCDKADALSFLSERTSEFISHWHTRIYRHVPRLFCSGYGYAENHPSLFDSRRWIYRYLSSGVGRLRNYIQRGDYDAVLCVHVFPALMMTELLRRHPLHIRTAFVSTDYTCSPITGDTTLDLYFIPHDDLVGEFTENGLDASKLVTVGIPVRQAFSHPSAKAEARDSLGLGQETRQIVLMGGSMGCGPIETLAEELSAVLPSGAEVSVMCGTNKKLAASLESKALPHVRVVGFTGEMDRWLAAADLFLTKPGGLSISESGTVGTPMLFLDTVGGCETHNRDFFVSHGWAECAGSPEEMAARCAALICDDGALAARADTLRRTFRRDAADRLVDVLSVQPPNTFEPVGMNSASARHPEILEGRNAHAITPD